MRTRARYGANEYRYARPIASALEADEGFRRWVLATLSLPIDAALMHREQLAQRSPNAENWWRSYWAGSAYQFKDECGERETDLLAVFQASNQRLAVHFEVKAPGDKFGLEQAMDYPRRASCWSGKGRAPKTVLEHDFGMTVLCCEAAFADRHPSEVAHFNRVISFESIAEFITPFPDTK